MDSKSPFAIDVEKLRRGAVEFKFEQPSESLDLIDVPDFEFHDPIAGRMRYSISGDDVFIRGTLSTRAIGQCVRCLHPSNYDIQSAIELTYMKQKAPHESREPKDEEIEELDVDYYSGDILDPKDALRDLILLELPALPLCDDECKGMCSGCGANLNHETCSCASAPVSDESSEPNPKNAWKDKLRSMKLD